MITSRILFARQPFPALTKLMLSALLLSVLAQMVVLRLIGQFDPQASLGLGFLVVAAALVLTPWRWAPAVLAVLAAIPSVGGLPYLLDHLAHPAAFGFFATTVVNLTCVLAAAIGGISATVQNYRGDRRAPRWLASVASGLIGLLVGALLVGGFLATRATEPVTATRTDGPPTVHLGPVRFAADRVNLPHGATLRLVNDGAFPHVIANGTWDDSLAKPGREPGAPPIADMQVSHKDQVVEIGPFAMTGSYQFYCPLHPGMQLAAIVQ